MGRGGDVWGVVIYRSHDTNLVGFVVAFFLFDGGFLVGGILLGVGRVFRYHWTGESIGL